jgi:hypothetical protein
MKGTGLSARTDGYSMQCSELPSVFAHQEGSSPFGEYTIISKKDDGFRILVRCHECDQHWQLDGEEKYGVALAIRVHYPDEWDEYSDYPARMIYLVKSHGGLTDKKCVEPGCQRKGVRGFDRCAHHLVMDWG